MIPASHLSSIKPSYIREILDLTANQQIVSLAGGLPCPDAFPSLLINELMPKITMEATAFQYSQTAGLGCLIDEIKSRYKVPPTHEVLITHGSQQGIDLCARLFIETGDKIVVEAPSYLGALQVFAIAKANIKSVPQQNDGPCIGALKQRFSQDNIKFFYAVPDFHNPTGCCWSLNKRRQVAQLCQQYNVLLIEDAPYRELRFSGKALPLVSSFCPEHAITLRSFSKILIPGVRIAALITPKRYYSLLIKLKQAMDLHSNTPMQQLVFQLLQHDDLAQHQHKVREIYKERYQTLATALIPLQDKGCEFKTVEGGMFIWLTIPPCDTMQLAKAAIKQGVAVVPSSEFYLGDSTQEPSALRLNFSYNNPATLKEAAITLCSVIESY